MPRTRKSHPPSLKAKVAVEAIKAHKTAAQIAQMFGVHPTQVGGWKKQALAGLPDIFGNGREQMRQQADTEKDELYKQLDLLSPAAAGERGEPASAPAARRAVPGMPVLWQPSHGRHAGGQPQTHPAADAHSGYRSALPETELEPPSSRSRDLPVPAARRLHRTAQPSLEHRYYLHSDAGRLPLPGGRDGLVQPLRAQLGTLQYDGDRLLFGRAGGGVPFRPARNLELRSGVPVHLARLSGAAKKARHLHQHGWTRPCPGQRFHRAPVAQPEVRTHLPWRLRQRGRSVPSPVHKEKIIAMMGGSAPQTPRDLELFFSRMDAFLFTRNGTCRTIEMLDRRIGPRRDATPAPIQARNGWRPPGRLLITPSHHLKDGQILSNLWGPPHLT